MTPERIERRILGAMRPVDAISGLPVTRRVMVTGEGLRLVRKPHGDRDVDARIPSIYVILEAPGLAEHTRAFERPPSTPALKSVKIPVKISDPGGTFLPRRFTLELPRDPDPQKPDSIFNPVPIPLYLAPTARPEISWAVVRGTVRQESTGERLPWSLVQVLKNADDSLLASGMADGRGEALLVVAGILFAMPADDSSTTLTRQIEVRLQASFDADGLRKLTDEDLIQARPDPNPGYLPDPQALGSLSFRAVKFLDHGAAAAASTFKIAAGQTIFADLLVDLP